MKNKKKTLLIWCTYVGNTVDRDLPRTPPDMCRRGGVPWCYIWPGERRGSVSHMGQYISR